MIDDTFTYGCELEWSDIDRSIDIPEEWGSWEGPKMAGYYMGSEIDIVNTAGRWRGVGTDPLCLTCPVGGEIRTVPSPDINSQFFRIMRIMNLFPRVGVACPNHGHIHVHVPGLKSDLKVLQNVFKYLRKNEENIIRFCCGYDKTEHDNIANSDLADWVKSYLLVGDGKHISDDLYQAIDQAEDIEEAMGALRAIECFDWDCITNEAFETPGSHRTAVNMFNLTKGDTIEFRIFRASLNPFEIYSCLKFVEKVVHEMVVGETGQSVSDIIISNHYEFPKLNYDYKLACQWQETRQTKDRGQLFKKSFSSATIISSDPIIYKTSDEFSGFEIELLTILDICTKYYYGYSLDEQRERLLSEQTATLKKNN